MAFWTPIADDGLPVFTRSLEPFGIHVWNQVAQRSAGTELPICRSDVIRDTILRVSGILADPIYRRFLSLRQAHFQASRSFHFQAFEDHLVAGGLDTLLDRHPALRRLLDRMLDNAVRAWCEIAHAIEMDRPQLANDGLLASDAEVAEDTSPAAGDFHDGGRSVTKVRFTSGALLYYKPRSGGADLVWNAMLNEVGASLAIHLPTVTLVDRGTHHWASAIQPSKHRDSLDYYYTQLGVLTFLVYLFQGIDFHCENLVATTRGPVVLDLEGLLHPSELPRTSLDPATAAAFSKLVASVINTGLLPCSIDGDDQASLGAMNPPIEASTRRVAPMNARTTAMSFSFHDVSDYWTAHTPLLPGDPFDEKWIRAVLAGFRLAYRACQGGGLDRAIATTLDALHHVELRFIARPTAHYYNALHEFLATAYDTQEMDEHAVLCRYLRSLPNYGVDDKLVEIEAAALAQFDIPRFIRSGGDLSVGMIGMGVVDLERPLTPIESSVERYRRLSAADLRFQESLLTASFGGLRKDTPLDSGSGDIPSTSDMLNLAVDCGRSLLSGSIRCDRNIAWVAATPVSSQRTSMTVCGLDLYAGLSGIALYLGELYRATAEPSFKEVATRCVETIRRRLQVEHSALGIGGGTGVGGILYAMACLSASLPDSCAPEVASWLCGKLTCERISADQSFDILDGAAGLLLGLIRLRSTQRYDAYEEACVQTLLAALVEAEKQGLRSWQTFEPGRCHSGMAHGSSGIAMALARRYSLAPSPDVLKAIDTALAFDETVDITADAMPVQWCHGAPGIALAHWAIDQCVSDATPRARALIDQTVSWTISGPENRTDGVCCGSMSRAATLFHTGDPRGLAEPPWKSLVASVCRGHQWAGTFRWSAGDDSLNPGLFVGVAGIGVELLRMSRGQTGVSPLLFS